ncbi:MAG: cache domain-containing protein, partial [Treponemataceae bacterium]|nr:cache domain-containing protein [Treponemataceae bacterium]
LMSYATGLEMTLKDWRDTLEADVMLLSSRPDIASGMATSNLANLRSILNNANGTLNVEVLVITDRSGVVLVGEGAEEGSSLSSLAAVQSALRGTAGYSYDVISGIGYSMLAVAPVRSGGKVIGTVIAAYSLENGDIVDQVRNSYSAECTIFRGNIRVSSSLGRNVIGTTMDDALVVSTVLREGNIYHGNIIINSKKYMSVYFPLMASNGNISGMAFIARPMTIIDNVRNHTLLLVAPSALLLIALLAFFSYRFVQWLMWRIYNVTNFLKELETGDADLTKRCKLFIRDEIGDLIIHFDFFLDKLQQIMTEVKGTKTELNASGSNLSAETADTASAISQILA